ncbi:beta-ketoacyl synthase N-terminal-like domain-containing protein [Aurantivibrio plasticivorans]
MPLYSNSTYIIGASCHSVLGDNLPASVPLLRQKPGSPSKLDCRLTGTETNVPYFLLSGCDYHDADIRYESVLTNIIQTAISDAGLNEQEVAAMGLFLGSSSFDIAREEIRYAKALEDEDNAIPLAECGMAIVAENIRKRFGIKGPDLSFNTACTSSANAAWYAHLAIQSGLIEHALVLTVEFANDTTTYGFQGLQLISQNGVAPFDERRDGIVLGESCAAAVLSVRPPVDGQRSISIAGGANLCDTYSMSITHEDGTAVADVIRQALTSADIEWNDIQAIKCHGTATIGGDAAEAKGMLSVFPELPRCAVIKPFIGHTLGACGLSELLLFGAAIQQGFVPGTPGLSNEGENLGFVLNQTPSEALPGFYLLNYFGFGGNNTSLVIALEGELS